MPTIRQLLPAILAMAAVVAASNVLVQYPVDVHLGAVHLADLLTWGAFSYPVAFLVTDLTNRRFGPRRARMVVVSGFAGGILLLLAAGALASNAAGGEASALLVLLTTPFRILLASGVAFLAAQLLDVALFDRLRRGAWWRAPLVSSVIASAIDTLLFFSLAFAPAFAGIDALFGAPDGSLPFPAPLLGLGGEVPLWVSLAAGDFCVKIVVALAMLAPYGALLAVIRDRAPAQA